MDANEVRIRLLQLGLLYVQLKTLMKKRKKIRRWWSKPITRYNYLTGYGCYTTVFNYFKLNDEEEFINFTNLNVQSFMFLLNLVRERLRKTSRRPSAPCELRLSLTLHYLAYGDSAEQLKLFYNIGLSTVRTIIPEVCEVLCDVLVPLVLKFPSAEEFLCVADDFYEELHFPNCIGAIDGRHCPIKKPPNSGSLFYNYKKFHSIVLMAICDSHKRFLWANIGDFGSFNDAGIFANSDLGQALSEHRVPMPPPTRLPNSEVAVPHYFIGDGGFPLKSYLMRPYMSNNNINVPQSVFNLRLSHARRIVECAFGDLYQKWSINEKKLKSALPVSENIIMSTVVLHNLLIDIQLNQFGRRWRPKDNYGIIHNQEPLENNIFEEHRLRQVLCDCFVSPEGSVPWQWQRL